MACYHIFQIVSGVSFKESEKYKVFDCRLLAYVYIYIHIYHKKQSNYHVYFALSLFWIYMCLQVLNWLTIFKNRIHSSFESIRNIDFMHMQICNGYMCKSVDVVTMNYIKIYTSMIFFFLVWNMQCIFIRKKFVYMINF